MSRRLGLAIVERPKRHTEVCWMALADENEINEFLGQTPDWSREDNSIVADFKFKDFNQAMGFVTRVALAAEKADHHPDIDIRWSTVRLVLSTHSEGGLTRKDFDLGAKIASLT